MVPLLEAIDTLNTLFDDLSEAAIAGLMAFVIQAAKSDAVLNFRALENSLENSLESERVRDRILDTLLAAPGELGKVVAEVVGDGKGAAAPLPDPLSSRSGRGCGGIRTSDVAEDLDLRSDGVQAFCQVLVAAVDDVDVAQDGGALGGHHGEEDDDRGA